MNFRFTTEIVRGCIIGIIYALWTVILALNVPVPGEGGTFFGGMIFLWAAVTTIGIIGLCCVAWIYMWVSCPEIADWLNDKYGD